MLVLGEGRSPCGRTWFEQRRDEPRGWAEVPGVNEERSGASIPPNISASVSTFRPVKEVDAVSEPNLLS